LDFLFDQQFSDAFWAWMARYASLAEVVGTTVGIPLGALALWLAWGQLVAIRQDQRRIADQLARRPRFEVGWGAALSPQGVTFQLTPNPNDPSQAMPFQLDVGALNDGDLSATNILVNQFLPARLVSAFATGVGDFRRDEIAGWRVERKSDYLHPGVSWDLGVGVVAPYAEDEFDLATTITCSEIKATIHVLHFRTEISKDERSTS
jgi:hypothetical protein